MIHRNELSVRIEPTGRYLRFRYDFVAPVPVEQACRALQDYFTKLRYSLVSSDDALVMKRGSLVRSWVNWAPRNLAAELTARFGSLGKDTAVMLELQLDRMGHIVYEAECHLLTIELVQAETYLHGGVVDFEAMKQLDRRIRNQAIHALLLTIGAAFLFGLLFLGILFFMLNVLGIKTKLAGALGAGIAGGVSAYIFMLLLESKLGPRRF